MADDDGEKFLVCLEATADPGDLSSTRGHYCTVCATEVWMSGRMRAFWKANPDATVVCGECSVGLAENDPNFRVEALPGDRWGKRILRHMPQILRAKYGRDPS